MTAAGQDIPRASYVEAAEDIEVVVAALNGAAEVRVDRVEELGSYPTFFVMVAGSPYRWRLELDEPTASEDRLTPPGRFGRP